MPTTSNQLLLTYWLILPDGDYSTPEEMRKAGQNGVTKATFTRGEKRLLCMVSDFDKSDRGARFTAALYAMRNAKRAAEVECPGANVWGVEVWLDGEKLSQSEIPK